MQTTETVATPAADVEQKQHTMESILATPDAFQKWLKGLPGDSVAGYRGEGNACPLAHFIRGYQGVTRSSADGDVLVSPRYIYWNWREYSAYCSLLPAWAITFIARIDRTTAKARSHEGVLVRECLAALHKGR